MVKAYKGTNGGTFYAIAKIDAESVTDAILKTIKHKKESYKTFKLYAWDEGVIGSTEEGREAIGFKCKENHGIPCYIIWKIRKG